MSNVVAFMEGGIVQNIVSDEGNVNLIIVDRDIEDLDVNEIKTVCEEDAYVIDWDKVDVNKDLVEKVCKEIGKPIVKSDIEFLIPVIDIDKKQGED